MRLIKNTTSILLLLLGVLCAVGRAQDTNREQDTSRVPIHVPPVELRVGAEEVISSSLDICIGSSLEVMGRLFTWGRDVTVISVKTAQGVVIDHNGSVSPTETTEYIMTYKTSSGESTASATVTVWQPAYIRIVGDNITGGDVCANQTLSFSIDSSAFVQGNVRWTVSTDGTTGTTAYGNNFSFTPTQSCELIVMADNDHCDGATTHTMSFNYLPKLNLSNVSIDFALPNYATCKECPFGLPDSRNWYMQASDGEIEKVELTWDDGTTGEKALTGEWTTFKCKVVFTIKKSNICEDVSAEVAKTIMLSVNGLLCEPELHDPKMELSSCEWNPVYLYAPYDIDTTHIRSYTNASFSISPPWPGFEVKDSVLFQSMGNSNGWEQAFFLRPSQRDKNNTAISYNTVYAADYTVACPYSTVKPFIQKSVRKEGTVQLDTNLLDVYYAYCDRYPGKLDVEGSQGWLKIETLMFDNIPADSFAFKFPGLNQMHYNTVHTIRTKINPNIDQYKKLNLRIVVSRDLEECRFVDTIVRVVELQKENYCDPYYTYDYDWNPFDYNSHCVGSEHIVRYSVPLYYQHIDSLKILSSSFPLSSEVENTNTNKQYTCSFQPYFSSKTDEDKKRQDGTITFVGYYHDIETLETGSDTIGWPLEIRTCPPIVQNTLNPDCRPRSACFSCPGSEWITSVGFVNPSTDSKKIKIQWVKSPAGHPVLERLDTNRPKADSLMPKPLLDGTYMALWRSHFLLYEPSDFTLEITYNEGDSVRTIRMDSSFRIDPVCKPRVALARDSCCVGDQLFWYIYADFYKYHLQQAQWNNPSSAVYPNNTEKEDYFYTAGPPRIRPRLAYRTEVQLPGLYPYTVQYKVNDTILTYSDTLRIHAVNTPKIFIEDSIYICEKSDVDLRQYIDSSMVRELIGVSSPSELLKKDLRTDKVYPLTAFMRYTCQNGNRKTNSLYVFVEGNVFLSFKDTTRVVCPLDSISLGPISSNGRMHWMKRRWKDGVLETENDTIWKFVRYNRSISDLVEADSALYTVVAFTACPKPAETETFKAISRPVPKIVLSDLHRCYPDTLHPKFTASGIAIEENTVQWFLKDEALLPPYAPTLDTTPIRLMVRGENGCWARADERLYNYGLPKLQTLTSICFHAGELDTLVLTGADEYDWKGNGRVDETDGARYILQPMQDEVAYVKGTDLATGCVSLDTLNVWLYAPRIAVVNDTLCRMAEWKQPFMGDSLTRIVWYFAGADFGAGSGDGGSTTDASGSDGGGVDGSGGASSSDGADVTPFGRLMGRDSLYWPSLQLSDTGLYTRISYRVACVDTQRYYLQLHPLPQSRLQGQDLLCEHDTLNLFYVSNARELYPEANAFTWYAPSGQPLASAPSADTLYYNFNYVQTTDSGWYAMRMSYGVCHWFDSLHLAVTPIPYPILPADTFFCETRYIMLDAFNPDYPDGDYSWQNGLNPMPGAGGEDQFTLIRVRDSGSYTATLVADGCIGEKVVKVEERPLPVFYMPIDTLVCRGVECMFYLPDHYDAYAWYEDSSANAVGFDSWQGYKNYGRVWVEVTHRGCADTLETFIDRVFCGRLYFPTAFTPNGNNVNDSFGPISVAEPEDLYYELTIVNPNNQVVFHSTNPKEMWDGTFKGVPCPPDTYMYTCKAIVRRTGRDVSMTGRIVLIR